MVLQIQGSCDPENHDCNCVDSSFAECSESEAENKVVRLSTCILNTHFLKPHHGNLVFIFQMHVIDLAACIFQCDFFHTFQGMTMSEATYIFKKLS